MVVLVRHRSGDIMLSCNILDMAVFFLFEDFFFPGHRCGGGVLVEALVILLRYESSTLILYKELSSTIFQSCQSVSQASVTPVQISTFCNV